MAQQGGLGRGLSSLIPQKKKQQQADDANYFGSGVADQKTKEQDAKNKVITSASKDPKEADQSEKISDIALKSIMEIPIESVSPNPHQPRDDFNEEGLQELADSIKEHGVLQPLIVSRTDSGGYELIAGERRLEASKIAGFEKVPVIVKKVSEQSKAELALIENVQRSNLNPMEEAKAYKKLQDTFALTQQEIATRVGKRRSTISNILRLLNLPIEIQKALVGGTITEGHARCILAVSNSEKQRAFFELILREGLTVRQAEDKANQVTEGTKKPRKRHIDPDLQAHEEKLSQALGTKVRIKQSKSGGQIAINFYSEEEFNALLTNLSQIQ